MKSVGIKRLKAQLSEYVRLAKAGETILVTERDEVVAELRPSRRQLKVETEIDDILAQLADAGELTRSSTPLSTWAPNFRTKKNRLPAGSAIHILDELRGDR